MTDQELDRALLRISRNRIAPRRKARRGPMRCKEYLAFLRSECKCVACVSIDRMFDRHPSSYRQAEPAHGPVNGTSSKGPDDGAIPLCQYHHREQHRRGWPAFESRYGFSREAEAAAHWKLFEIWREAQ